MNLSLRQYVRPWLLRHPPLYHLSMSAFLTYCKLTGPLHVLPDFLIIGAAKCGTTSLYEYLIKHPSIFPCLMKEPNYFGKHYRKGTGWYRSYFPHSWTKYYLEKIKKEKFFTGEASALYYSHPHAPKRAKQLVPNAKIIVLLRNPVDRSYSWYQSEARLGLEKLPFEDAIKQERQRILDEYKKMLEDEYYYSNKYVNQSYLANSIYVDFLKRWMEFFSKEHFLFIRSEDFFHQPSKVLNEVLKFLGLPSIKLDKYETKQKGNYQPMDPIMRKKLIEYFKPHNEQLYKFLRRDFHWDN